MADNTELLAALTLKVGIQENRMEQMEGLWTKTFETSNQLITELHGLTANLRVLIEQHDQVDRSHNNLLIKHEHLDERVKNLEITSAANQPIIEGIRAIGRNLLWMFLATIAMQGLQAYTLINKTEKVEKIYVETASPARDSEQQSGKH
jgi:uncharacterized protein YdcH (DUF465 family)